MSDALSGRAPPQAKRRASSVEAEAQEATKARGEAPEEDSPRQRRQDDQLRLVLKAHALHDEHVRYCQAMGFIAQMVLTEVNSRHAAAEDAAVKDTAIEAEAFGVLTSLVNDFGCRQLFAQGMGGLKCCFFQLDACIKSHLPRLREHFDSENVATSMYATGWFLTLFTNCDTLSVAHARAVLTATLADGWKCVFRVALALLAAMQTQLLGSDFEGMLRLLQHPQHCVERAYPTPADLLEEADGFKVTHTKLRQLEAQFLAEASV